MRHMFESLGYQSGFFLSQLFSSSRNTNLSPSPPPLKQAPARPPQPVFNWAHRPSPSQSFHHPPRIPPATNKDDTGHLFLLPHPDDDVIADHESDLKWPNGLSFFNALTGRTDEAKLLFGSDGLGSKPPAPHLHQHQLSMAGKNASAEEAKAEVSGSGGGGGGEEEYLGLEQSGSGKARKAEGNKFKRSFSSPAAARMSSSSSGNQGMEYRSSEAGIYSDIMESFLE